MNETSTNKAATNKGTSKKSKKENSQISKNILINPSQRQEEKKAPYISTQISEIIGAQIFSLVYSYFQTDIYRKQVDLMINGECLMFVKNQVTPWVKIQGMEYDKEDCILLNSEQPVLTPVNNWEDVVEPGVPVYDRYANTWIKVKKEPDINMNNNNIIHEYDGSWNDTKNALNESSTANNITKTVMKHSPVIIREEEKKTKTVKRKVLIDFPSYDIKNFQNNLEKVQPFDVNELRRDYEREKELRLARLKAEEEIEKQRRHQFLTRTEQTIDLTKYTFDPDGKIIPIRHFKIESLGSSNEFYWSNNWVRLPQEVDNIEDNTNKNKRHTLKHATLNTITNTNQNNTIINNKIDLFTQNDYKNHSIANSKKQVEKSQPSGSNYHWIKPEVGVTWYQDQNQKGGRLDYISKYNKTSIYEYSQFLNESLNYNNSMVKRGVISAMQGDEMLSNQYLLHKIDEHPYYDYKDKISSQNNPLCENATKQAKLPSILISNNNLNPTLISTANNPWLNSNNNKTYNFNSSKLNGIKAKIDDRIIINSQSVQDLQMMLSDNAAEETVKTEKNKKMIKNYSDLGSLLKKGLKKEIPEEIKDYSKVNKFNKQLMKNDSYWDIKNNGNNYYNLGKKLFANERIVKGDCIRELGQNIVQIKMPRQRKINMEKYNYNSNKSKNIFNAILWKNKKETIN